MATENFGLKIGLEGEKEFKSQIYEINLNESKRKYNRRKTIG